MVKTRRLVFGLVGVTTVVCLYLVAGRSAPREVVPGSESVSSQQVPPNVPTPGRITPENARRIVIGMSLAEVERLLGPARVEANSRCLPLYPPGSVMMTKDGPLYADMHWASGTVAITVRVNNQTKCVRQIWASLPG